MLMLDPEPRLPVESTLARGLTTGRKTDDDVSSPLPWSALDRVLPAATGRVLSGRDEARSRGARPSTATRRGWQGMQRDRGIWFWREADKEAINGVVQLSVVMTTTSSTCVAIGYRFTLRLWIRTTEEESLAH